MLTPHACHTVELKEVRNGNTNKVNYVIRWCKDCNVRVWHDGSDVGEYFINKSNKDYDEYGCIVFVLYCIEMSQVKKNLAGLSVLKILLNEVIQAYEAYSLRDQK